jgi:uncharacterized membrane protein (UPF0136 family)
MDNRRATISAAIIALICFFLPWIQVSCGATRETASGIDLARDGNAELWLIPLLMLAVLFAGLRLWKQRDQLTSVLSLISGLISAYLMNHERLKFEDSDGLIRVGVTGWFWLGLGSSVAIVVLAAARLLRMRKVTTDA